MRNLLLTAVLVVFGWAVVWVIAAGGGCGDESEEPRHPFTSPLAAAEVVKAVKPRPAKAVGTKRSDSQASGLKEMASAKVVGWESIEDFDREIVRFDSVFWDPRDTESLRKTIRETGIVQGKTVLEIGTGTGLVALCCLKAGAKKAVATDVNRNATFNALYNARLLGVASRLETRLVPLGRTDAYSVIGESEKFDLIISNPPWEDRKPVTIAEHALYDREFALLRSLLKDLTNHLKPNGRAFLVYGCTSAIAKLKQLAAEYGLNTKILDDRDPETLPEMFLPGMLIEVTPRKSEKNPNVPAQKKVGTGVIPVPRGGVGNSREKGGMDCFPLVLVLRDGERRLLHQDRMGGSRTRRTPTGDTGNGRYRRGGWGRVL